MAKKPRKSKPDQFEREAQLRRRMLSVARLSAPTYAHGFVPFGLIVMAKDDNGMPCDSDEQAERLVNELQEWGLLEPAPTAGMGGLPPTNKHRRLKLTDKAFALWMRDIPPISGVADDRVI